jgi:hypothetical protein
MKGFYPRRRAENQSGTRSLKKDAMQQVVSGEHGGRAGNDPFAFHLVKNTLNIGFARHLPDRLRHIRHDSAAFLA